MQVSRSGVRLWEGTVEWSEGCEAQNMYVVALGKLWQEREFDTSPSYRVETSYIVKSLFQKQNYKTMTMS